MRAVFLSFVIVIMASFGAEAMRGRGDQDLDRENLRRRLAHDPHNVIRATRNLCEGLLARLIELDEGLEGAQDHDLLPLNHAVWREFFLSQLQELGHDRHHWRFIGMDLEDLCQVVFLCKLNVMMQRSHRDMEEILGLGDA